MATLVFTETDTNKKSVDLNVVVIEYEYHTILPCISNYPRAFTFSMTGGKIESLEYLVELKKLATIKIIRTDLTDISHIKHLKRLRNADLSNNKITDLEPLASLEKLRQLNISSNPIVSFTSLGRLNSISILHLDNLGMTSLNIISNLASLEKLYVRHNELVSADGVEHLVNLVELDISHNKITCIKALKHLAKLRKLSFDSNCVADLSPLAFLAGLSYLSCQDNDIYDVSSLQGCANLITLDVASNNVSDMSALVSLKSLTKINACFNPLVRSSFGALFYHRELVVDAYEYIDDDVYMFDNKLMDSINSSYDNLMRDPDPQDYDRYEGLTDKALTKLDEYLWPRDYSYCNVDMKRFFDRVWTRALSLEGCVKVINKQLEDLESDTSDDGFTKAIMFSLCDFYQDISSTMSRSARISAIVNHIFGKNEWDVEKTREEGKRVLKSQGYPDKVAATWLSSLE